MTHPAVELLRAATDRDPARVAVRTSDGPLTAAELGRRVRSSATRWTQLGAAPGDVVLVVGERSVEQPITLLGAWTAGLIPVLAEDLPDRRLERLARDTEARWVVKVATGERSGRRAGARTVPADASHVLFTSGTTGEPAGVVVGPESISAALQWFTTELAPGPDDRVAMLGGLGHDPLLREILLPLLGRGELIVPSPTATRDPRELVHVLRDGGVTILNATPSLVEFGLGHLSEGIALPSLRLVLLGGEAPTARSVQLLRAAGAARILNVYGATETPQVAAAAEITETTPVRPVPVGRGVGGYQLVLGSETPGWFRAATGCEDDEVIVRAPHLARGYLAVRGRRRFVADPLGEPGWSAYLTGDRGAADTDRGITVTGRVDREIGLNGHRIHPSEVEAAAEHLQGILAANCRVEHSELGSVLSLRVLTDPQAGLRARTVRASLREVLPAWAVPSRIEIEEGAAALTANHKRAW